MTDVPRPVWGHGYRRHGYWLGIVRWGFVSLPSPRFGRLPAKDGYGWELTPRGIVGHPRPRPGHSGTADTLRAAKRAVEAAYRRFLGEGR